MNSLQVFGLVLLLFAAVILLPHLLIWSLNELFDLSLAHDAGNWLAALVLGGFMSSGGGSRS